MHHTGGLHGLNEEDLDLDFVTLEGENCGTHDEIRH